jgi:DNA (cytosine-5)-methyltransferase 1
LTFVAEGGAQLEGPHDTANIRAASGGSSRSYVAAVAFDAYNQKQSETAASLRCGAGGVFDNTVMQHTAVRRLTPRECERLQGFPDDYTNIPWRGKETPDGPRYKALGNSMAVPCMAWIGQRIAAVAQTR